MSRKERRGKRRGRKVDRKKTRSTKGKRYGYNGMER